MVAAYCLYPVTTDYIEHEHRFMTTIDEIPDTEKPIATRIKVQSREFVAQLRKAAMDVAHHKVTPTWIGWIAPHCSIGLPHIALAESTTWIRTQTPTP
ncbi:hypothetical protein WS58_01835 [Burkholderia pseudomultivorans]|nr:hypothetical protein WS57_03450 [Burkholderia pseudomultivorans]KUZ12729.1 hypothetical protein WI28_13700 [Burkholderia diffusa]KVC24579.1 hypothetical protein WS56_29475 [Burkholderia pseudomultivorans]KVC36945.1 hypothetical protein WS58_01835 [Burkholderia pseudomultivorans]KVC38071.1 hypothetical protein WS55_28175 [Burkholderia pseudomultivorans]